MKHTEIFDFNSPSLSHVTFVGELHELFVEKVISLAELVDAQQIILSPMTLTIVRSAMGEHYTENTNQLTHANFKKVGKLKHVDVWVDSFRDSDSPVEIDGAHNSAEMFVINRKF